MESILRLKPDVEWQPVDDEIVVLDLEASAYLAVNNTGARLWPLLAAGSSHALLVEELASRFGVEDRQARADVAAFVDRLRSLSLIVEEG